MNIKIKLKKKLLKLLLEDREIQNAVRKIIDIDDREDEIQKLQQEIEMLNEMIEKIKRAFSNEESKNSELSENISIQNKDLERLNREKNRLEQKINSLKIELNSSKEEIKKYRDVFEEELKIYDKYLKLSNSTKASLKGIFKDDTLKGFFACGVQEKNISSLWEYIRVEIIEDKNSDIDALIEIFNSLFEKYLMAYPIYVIQDVKEGDRFNTDSHIRDSQSSASGKVSKVLLKGWINSRTARIIKKSVVRVE